MDSVTTMGTDSLQRHIINLDADPFVPDRWTVQEHRHGGSWQFNADEVTLFLDKRQRDGKNIKGKMIYQDLKAQSVMNANVLDYLLKNNCLIPEDWKEDGDGKSRYICFWGTIYRDWDGLLYVRFLSWDGIRWTQGSFWIGTYFRTNYPAAVRV